MREHRLRWHDHHMLLALITAQRSPDPNTQVGACIVDASNRILGLGYNGLPKGISPNQIPWNREHEDLSQTKYPYIVHAEKNAIFNSTGNVQGATLFVSLFPCHNCAKDIIQAGVKNIVYLTNLYEDSWEVRAANDMFSACDIKLAQHKWHQQTTEFCLNELLTKIKYNR